ncbi:MAG: outer membrane protein assembly factor BamE [Sulfuricella sp.]|nr:outer membrane protein assembly factor BamE [Sulfuricella sp.]
MRLFQFTRFTLVLLLTGLSAGCGSWSSPFGKLSPYKIDIQQGNDITQEMVDRLKLGMTASQVRFVLGTPLLGDPFHPTRWDYVYRYQNGTSELDTRRLSVVFEDDKLKKIDINAAAAPTRVQEGAGK